MVARGQSDPLAPFHPAVRAWFTAAFPEPTKPQALGWAAIARGESALILAPTGSGKTLAAFLWCLDRLMFAPPPTQKSRRCRVLYVSPLKALAADVERNLRAPLAGIAQTAESRGDPYVAPTIAIRTGDTPAAERARFQRNPDDLLITTPESLYLLLTSNARDVLRGIDTIIIDEIHALVPTKRGAHLAVSLERLTMRCDRPPQRIGLSATQRPLDEVARFLGGVESSTATRRGRHRAASHDALKADIDQQFADEASALSFRPVTVIDAGTRKRLKLTIEVPLERGSTGSKDSVWAAIHPRLLELIRNHRSTLVFANSRRLAERLAAAINELAGETLVRSHHGSLARAQRTEVEEMLKAGRLRALVATSSLELGIDMGAIDLVIQIEAPPSVASGLQRIGRGGHTIGAVSEGIIFPKFRGDLVASAAVARAMHDGQVEPSHYPRNPLDIAAQHMVAMAAMDEWDVDDLYATIRRAAPFAELSRRAFDGLLEMLSGHYPSDEFAELRPRITWNRRAGTIVAREGARHVAITSGGTIPDRGLYGVFLAGAPPGSARVGELDEEMVFESRVGETFVLGASSWRIEEITHDRVLVSPAPGEPGKMPFWRGDRAGRPLELGLAIGRLTHNLMRLPPSTAVERLRRDHDLDASAAETLLQYLRDQAAAAVVPDAFTIVIERVRDELGDWRICVLSPRGGRIHAPWAMATAAVIRDRRGIDVDTLWGDDGFVVRFPDVDPPPEIELVLPDPDEVQGLVVRQLGATALFAAKFRENAGRSLLLPKGRPGMRAPLWHQRKKAADLLAVAARYGSFPMLLETYRECLRDFFDMPSLVATLQDVRSRKIRVATVDSDRPSPFAASLLFSYVASFLYDGDAPLAERRAQALSVDQGQLSELIGDAELRELLDGEAMEAIERQLQRLDPRYQARSADGLHDMLLALGDLSAEEVRARATDSTVAGSLEGLMKAGRIISIRLATGDARYIAVEHASRYRDGLHTPLPSELPASLLEPVGDPLGDIALRYARTHAPFTASEFSARYGIPAATAEQTLVRLVTDQRLLEGEFRPGGTHREWTDASVLQQVRRRSLAKLRREVEPVDQAALGRLAVSWQGVISRRQGSTALLDAIHQLQGAPIAASLLETEILPARVERYEPTDLDALMGAGEIVWVGIESLGERDGRVALYLADMVPRLLPPRSPGQTPDSDATGRERLMLDFLAARGASFFGPLHEAAGGGYPAESVDALWSLVWKGLVTNDTLHALRAFTRPSTSPGRHGRRPPASAITPRRLAPSSGEGRWSLVPKRTGAITAWATAIAQQLLARHGVLTREAVMAESPPGGFGLLYPILKAMEESGRVRRGYFVARLGAAQFALPGALDLLRSLRDGSTPDQVPDLTAGVDVAVLSATDPANPYGAALKWPAFAPYTASAGRSQAALHAAPAGQAQARTSTAEAGRGPTRSVGATVVIVGGALAAYLARGERQLLTWLPETEPNRSKTARIIARVLLDRARSGGDSPRGMLIEEIDGGTPTGHPLGPFLLEGGFRSGALGFQATYD